MNENRLSRVVFNNQSCRLCRAAHAARTRIRMASEQDEEEERVLHDVIRSSEISIWKAAGGVEQQMHSPLSEKSVREGLDFAA